MSRKQIPNHDYISFTKEMKKDYKRKNKESTTLWCFQISLSGSGQDLIPEDFHQLVQLFYGGMPAQRDPERAVHPLGGNFHGVQGVAAVALGAGRTCGYANAVILENVDGVLGGHTGNGEIQNVGRLVAAVDADAADGGKLLHQMFQKGGLSGNVIPEGGIACGAGGGKTENGGGCFRAAAHTVFLTAAQNQGGEGL